VATRERRKLQEGVVDLRCDNTLHAVLIDGLIEVKCRHYKCGARSGVVVLHRFDPITGDFVETKMYRTVKEVKKVATSSEPAAIRSS
jgi:hypothetical protein